MKGLLELGLDSEIYTVDLSSSYYKDKNKETGYLADEYALMVQYEKYKKFTGYCLAEVIKEIKGDIDFVFLDVRM